MKDLTERQKEALSFISGFIEENGKSPTLREIGSGLGVSHSAARDMVLALARKGRIERSSSKLRSLSLPESERMKRENVPVPFFPSEPSMEMILSGSERSVFIPRSEVGESAFAFTVSSESMRNAGILPGDIAIMKSPSGQPENGDIILASYADEDAAMELRRYRMIGNGYAELWPENDTMGIIKVMSDSLAIAGILMHIRRDYTTRRSR